MDSSSKQPTSASTISLIRGGTSAGRGRSDGRGRDQGRGRGRGGRHSNNATLNNNITSQQTNTKTEMPICTFYLAGRCNFGVNCRFYHPDANSTMLTVRQQQQVQRQSSTLSATSSSISYKPPREFDAFKAEAINIAKTAQDMEISPFGHLNGPFYSMDIECVACGFGHTDKQRYPCRVSLVKAIEDDDNDVEVLVDEIVNLNNVEVVNYLTPLTGMSAEQCLDPNTKDLDEIRSIVRSHLITDAILVGHSIWHDIEWLGLELGVDFKQAVDTSCIFRQRIPKNLNSAGNTLRHQVENSQQNNNETNNNNDLGTIQVESKVNSIIFKDEERPDDTHLPFPTKYRLFSLRHCCIHLLDIDIQENAHNPIMDAKFSLILFNKYRCAPPPLLRAIRDTLHRAPPTPSFAAENPLVGGVVLSIGGYRLKWTGRFIWKWWVRVRDQNQNVKH